MTMTIFSHLRNAVVEHAQEEFPREACGLAVSDDSGYVRYVPVKNVHPTPEAYFEHDPRELARYHGLVRAVIHSHTDDTAYPSSDDMRSQVQWGLPFGLVTVGRENVACEPWYWGDGVVPEVPLEGREFRHGPTGTDGRGDCYALVRDWYRVNMGGALPEFPRDHDWWRKGLNMYVDNMAKLGFERVSEHSVAKGDIAIIKIRSQVANHSAIYVGNGLIIHHLTNRLSRIEPVGMWSGSADAWMRPPWSK